MLVGTTRTRKRPPTTELLVDGHSCPTLQVNEVVMRLREVGHQTFSFAYTLNVFNLGLVSADRDFSRYENPPMLCRPRFSLAKQPRCPLIKPGLLIALRCAVMLVITMSHRCTYSVSETKPLTYNCLREGECSPCLRSM